MRIRTGGGALQQDRRRQETSFEACGETHILYGLCANGLPQTVVLEYVKIPKDGGLLRQM